MKSNPCEKCRPVEYEVAEKDIIDVLDDLASQTNARVEVISTESEEKAKLAALGGFAALLRYRPNKTKLYHKNLSKCLIWHNLTPKRIMLS